MIWIQHDFYSNFLNSVGSGDTELTLSIFTSEVTDLVVHNPAKLLEMFEKTGVKISKKASDEEIIDVILDRIQDNNKFVRGLAILMFEWNDVKSLHKITTEAQILNIIGKLSACIRKVASEVKKPSVRGSIKKDIMAMITLKVGVDGVRSGIDGAEKPRDIYKKDNTVLYLVLGVAAAFGAYYLYKYFKAKKEAQLLAAGGAVSTDVTATAATSVVVDPVAAQPTTAAVADPVAQPATGAAPAVATAAAPVKTNHPMPSGDVYIVAAPVAPAANVQPAVAQSSVNVNAVPNA